MDDMYRCGGELEQINRIYDASDAELYPEEFLHEYDRMECLAERNGIDTFLVQNHAGNRYIAKYYDKGQWKLGDGTDILQGLQLDGVPKHITAIEDAKATITIREYIEGTPLDQYAAEHALQEQEIIGICIRLCDILQTLHHRERPIIHRDIKPQNIIIGTDGKVSLIDFDIAREWRPESEADTRFFGTVAYAPPEQYGFSQTDARTDIYSLGVLLRFLITGSTRENPNIRIYKPLDKIIRKCTAFAPDSRYADAADVRRALQKANPKAQRIRAAKIAACAAAVCVLMGIGIHGIYDYVTFDPFGEGHIPSVMQDEERAADAVDYLAKKYGVHLFDDTDAQLTFGMLRDMLTDIYNFDYDYVHYLTDQDPPQESDDCFFPWGKGNEQYVTQNELAYTVVKIYWPDVVTDWSSLKDDNGEYPGARVAYNWCEKYGILTGVKRPNDLTCGEAAIAFANADRVYEAMQEDK